MAYVKGVKFGGEIDKHGLHCGDSQIFVNHHSGDHVCQIK